VEPASGVRAFPDCNLGLQSPVDLPAEAPLKTGLVLAYREARLHVLNNRHTIQVDHGQESTMSVDGEIYRLLQFHLHSPAEHQVAGLVAPLEAHFVHRAADGTIAVLAVFMRDGAANPTFEQVLDVMPGTPSAVGSSSSISAAGMLPDDLSFHAYDGSLTTPPCTEGVRWFVLGHPIEASGAQIDRFRALPFLSHEGEFVGNARPVQPLNGRFGAAPRVTPPATGDGGLQIAARTQALD
jgi:carbonic anhydrase